MIPGRVLMTADAVGGVWTYCQELARGLGGHGVEVLLAVMGTPPSAIQRAEVSQLRNVRLEVNPLALEWMDEPWNEVEEAGEWLLALEAEFSPDLVHLNGYVHAALPWSVPVLVAAHSCVLSWWRAVKGEEAPSYLEEYRRRVQEGLLAADLVIAPTQAMLAALTHEYGELTNTAVVLNGRNAAKFKTADKERIIFSAGRLWDEAKNLKLLDEIAPGLSWPVSVAGETSGPAASESTFANLYKLGKLTETELVAQLAGAAIYAAPAFYEPFGLGILEAALSGCALVLSDIPSLRELWDGTAVFVSPHNADAWTAALQELPSNPAERDRLAALSLRRGRLFTVEASVEGHLAAYRELLVQKEVFA